MTTRSRKPGKEIQAVPPAVDANSVTRNTRKTPNSQGGTKQRRPQKQERKPPGRKPWIPDLEKIENWARQGLKDSEIAALCGVCKQTFSERKTELNEQKEPSELADALARGRAKGTSMASAALWQAIAGGDVNAIKFFLERRAGWTAKQVIEQRDLSTMSIEDLLALLEECPEC